MFARLKGPAKEPPVTPLILSDRITGAGNGRKLCLVTDSRATTAPTAKQASIWLAEDGWDVTMLDLSYFQNVMNAPHTLEASQDKGNKPANIPYTYVRLPGGFRERNWYAPMQSLCAYQWLRDRGFDVIIFQHGFGAGHFSCVARHLGLAFSSTPLLLLTDDTYMRWLEDAGWMPTALRTDMELDYLERETVRRADGLLCTDKNCLEWMATAEWSLPTKAGQLAVLGETGQPYGEWIAERITKAPRPATSEKSPILISVCMATYNRPIQLREALASLESQTYQNFEVIVIDDGSTDPKMEALRKQIAPIFTKRGWRWEKQENGGPSVARAHAVRLSKGSHLLFMDDDNTALPDELEIFARASATGADILTCIYGLDPRSDPPPPEAYLPSRPACKIESLPVSWVPYGGHVVLNIIFNSIGDTNALFRREVYDKLGGFHGDRDMLMEDWEFMIRAAIAGCRIEVIPEVLMLNLRHRGSRHLHGPTVTRSHIDTLKPIAELMHPSLHPLLLCLRAPMHNGIRWLSKQVVNPGRFRTALVETQSKAHVPHRRFRSAPSDATIKVALCFDDNYAMPACIMLASLFSVTARPIEAYAITSISPENADLLMATVSHFKNHIIKIIPVQDDVVPFAKIGEHSSRTVYSRIFLPKYLPHLHRVLYLDCDLIVRKDIADLWDFDLAGNLIGAISDVGVALDNEHCKKYGGDYFNSGVMLIDLDGWRKEKITTKVLKWIDHFEKNPDPRQYWDQSPINKAIAGRWLSLSPTWNLTEWIHEHHHNHYRLEFPQFEEIRNDPHIFHFVDPKKPWLKPHRFRTNFAREYQVYEKLVRVLQKTGLERDEADLESEDMPLRLKVV